MAKVNGGKLLMCKVDLAMNTSASMLKIRSAVRVNSNGHQETTTKGNTKMMKEMVMEKCLGPMALDTLVNG